VPRLDLQPVPRRHHLQLGRVSQQLGQDAVLIAGEVLEQNQGEGRVTRNTAQQRREGFETARRRPDRRHQERWGVGLTVLPAGGKARLRLRLSRVLALPTIGDSLHG
jgi:hypothetical protein